MQSRFANVDPNAADPYASAAEQERRKKQFQDAYTAAQGSLDAKMQALVERGKELRLDAPHDETLVELFLGVVSGGEVINRVLLSASCGVGDGQFTINGRAVSVQQALPCAVPALLSRAPGSGRGTPRASFTKCLIDRTEKQNPGLRESAPSDCASHAALRVQGSLKPPTKIKDVKPIYPAEAQTKRVQGMVIAEVTIGPDGKVCDAKIVRSVPPLDLAALDAVRQWEFTPTLQGAVPVPVIMTITMNFAL